jgi:hypothetical protein
MAAPPQIGHQMSANKTTRAGDEDQRLFHLEYLSWLPEASL